jgi:hypothetical protein
MRAVEGEDEFSEHLIVPQSKTRPVKDNIVPVLLKVVSWFLNTYSLFQKDVITL